MNLLTVASGCDATDVAPSPDAAVVVDQAVDAEAVDVGVVDDMSLMPADMAPLPVDMAPPPVDMAPPPVDMAPPPVDMAPPPADMGPLPACEGLRIEPGQAFARAFDLVTFRAEGASNGRRFEFVDNASGAILNEETGAYLAGDQVGVSDVIRLIDPACTGEVRARVQVVEGMQVRPNDVSIEPLQRFTFEVLGGSGDFGYEIVMNNTGAAVDPREGLYVAGDQLGQDLVRITDLGTGQLAEVFVTVVQNVVMQARPPQLILPVGASHPLEILGGSGDVELANDNPNVIIEDGMVRAVAPGRVNVELRDRFFDLSTTMQITAVDSFQPPLTRSGDGSSWTRFHAPGDLNGDGFADAVVGYSEADVGYADAGAVYVYHGSPDGLGPAPAQVLHGPARRTFYGRSVLTGDIDGDGQIDLLVGAHLADIGSTDSGAVFIHQGQPDGTFSEEPWQVIPGPQNGDQAGRGMALCDLNGDERLDLIVGAWLGEDRSLQNATNQGTLAVHLGYEEGLLDRPDQIVVGVFPNDAGELEPRGNQRIGMDVVGGDIDGDGLCDIVTSTTQLGLTPGDNGDGLIYVYKGQLPDGINNGGLTPLPVRIISRGIDEPVGRNLGRRLAIGDVNGDGMDDVLLARHADHRPEGGNNAGSVWLIQGEPMEAEPATGIDAVTDAAAWHVYGDNGGDNLGIGVDVSDLNGDGLDDLVVGAWFDELPDQPQTGTVHVYNGRRDALPELAPSLRVGAIDPAASSGTLIGEHAVVLGDVDGDGRNDLMLTAAREDTIGWDIGRWYVYPGGDSAVGYPVEMPGDIGGQRFGNGVAVIPDVNGDGRPDAIVGAPFQGFANSGRTGRAWIFEGTNGGFSLESQAPIGGYPNHSGFDLTGWAVGPAGDFDGDGNPDWAVAARDDETQNNGNFERIGNCITNGNSGTIYIFRGQADGSIATRPSWAVQGRRGNALLHMIAHADVNGDGLSDLIGGAPFSDQGGNDRGEVIVVLGRPPANDDRIRVLCDPVLRFVGEHNGANLGRGVIGLGDLNGDGCEEFAFGAPRSDIDGRNNQGVVRVTYGWGGPGCPAQPQAVLMSAAENFADVGWSLAAANLDGDNLMDLVVGAPNHLVDGQRRGGVWVVPASYINRLRKRPIEETRADADTFDPRGAVWVVEGQTPGERFGTTVAAATGLIGVGSPLGAYSGVPQVGGARFYRVGNAGVDPEPVAAFIGQTWRPQGRLGEALHMMDDGQRTRAIIGGFDASGPRVEGFGSADPGGAYGFVITRLGR